MTFTQSVPVAFLARQVPQHRVRVRPCQSRGDASPGQFRSPALERTVIRKSCVVVLKVVAGAVHMTCLALPACLRWTCRRGCKPVLMTDLKNCLALRACLRWTCPTVCCTANRRLAITHGVVCGHSRRGCNQVLMTNFKNCKNCIFASHVTTLPRADGTACQRDHEKGVASNRHPLNHDSSKAGVIRSEKTVKQCLGVKRTYNSWSGCQLFLPPGQMSDLGASR